MTAAVRIGQRALSDSGVMPESVPTGRRRVVNGCMRAEMRRRDGSTWWPLCRAHENCSECAAKRDHVGCPVKRSK